jgi:hypothetical protein
MLRYPYDIVIIGENVPQLRTTDAIATFACREGRILITNDIEIYRAAYDQIPHHPGVIEMETKSPSRISGEALLGLLSQIADPRTLLTYDVMQDSLITILIDKKGQPHFDLFDRFP